MPYTPEPNHGLSFAQENFMTIREDGQLLAIEEQVNGHVIRHATEVADRGKSLSIFGADKAQNTV